MRIVGKGHRPTVTHVSATTQQQQDIALSRTIRSVILLIVNTILLNFLYLTSYSSYKSKQSRLVSILNPFFCSFPVLLGACHNDASCLQDKAGLEAITQLHRQLDDDANGNVDLSESDDVSTNNNTPNWPLKTQLRGIFTVRKG